MTTDDLKYTKYYPIIPKSDNIPYKAVGNMIGSQYLRGAIIVATEYLVILIFLADLPTFTKLNKGYIETSMNDVDDAKTTLNALISSHVTE
jgi:Na+-transporting NADH:ubiquinone oxidoreductase subunit NqrB